MYSKHSYISICMRVAMCCCIYTSHIYIYTVHSIHHIDIYYQCFNRLRHKTKTKSPVETVRSWCSWHIESRHSPLRASVSPIGPRLRKKKGPLVMKLLCWFISLGLLWFIKVMYIYIWLYMVMIMIYI